MTRKRRVYYYRRRLPHPHKGELALSLLARLFREAENLAAPLDRTLSSVMIRMSDSPDLRTIWPELVEQRLDDDLEKHPFALPGCPPFVMHSDERQVSVDAELDAIDHLLSTAAEARARRDHSAVDRALRELTERYSMPE